MALRIVLACFGVLFVGACGWLGWALRELARARRELNAGRLLLEQATGELVRCTWFLWWLRNAVECTPLDPGRTHLMRLALAAQLAPSMEAFERDLHSIVHDPQRPITERNAAKGFLSEREVARRTGEMPWQAWERETGKPLWSPEAQREAYACALQSWIALFTRRIDEQVPGQPEQVPDRTH